MNSLYDGDSNPFANVGGSSPRAPAPVIPPTPERRPNNDDDALGLATTPPHAPRSAAAAGVVPPIPIPIPATAAVANNNGGGGGGGGGGGYGRSVREEAGSTPNRLMHVNAQTVELERRQAAQAYLPTAAAAAAAAAYGRSTRGNGGGGGGGGGAAANGAPTPAASSASSSSTSSLSSSFSAAKWLGVADDGLQHLPKNFPACLPLIYHSVEEQVPPEHVALVSRVQRLWLATAAALCWNFVVCVALLGKPGGGGGKPFVGSTQDALFWSAMYVAFGVPCAWRWWYMCLYRATTNDSSTSYFFFFGGFGAHCAFAVAAALGVPGSYLTGFLTGVDVLLYVGAAAPAAGGGAGPVRYPWRGVMCLASTLAWGAIAHASVTQFRVAHAKHRSRGMQGMGHVQRDASRGVGQVAMMAAAVGAGGGGGGAGGVGFGFGGGGGGGAGGGGGEEVHEGLLGSAQDLGI
jgi:hypothetical protein